MADESVNQPEEAEGKKAKKDRAKGKAKGKGTAGKGRRARKGAAPDDAVSIASHPRASTGVRTAKGWGGLAGFAIAALLSIKASVPFGDIVERALLFGVIGYLVAWALSLLVWRQLILAEQRAAIAELERRAEQRRQREQEELPSRKTAAAGGGGPS